MGRHNDKQRLTFLASRIATLQHTTHTTHTTHTHTQQCTVRWHTFAWYGIWHGIARTVPCAYSMTYQPAKPLLLAIMPPLRFIVNMHYRKSWCTHTYRHRCLLHFVRMSVYRRLCIQYVCVVCDSERATREEWKFLYILHVVAASQLEKRIYKHILMKIQYCGKWQKLCDSTTYNMCVPIYLFIFI